MNKKPENIFRRFLVFLFIALGSGLQWAFVQESGSTDGLLWIKIAYTTLALTLVPIYWKHWGPANFLWFSDIALFVTATALWLENRLLASMMAVGVLVPEVYWNLEFLVRLFTGYRLGGLTDYMWERDHPLFLRLLSLFHVVLLAAIIFLIIWLGYDPRAIYYQTVFGWLIILLTYFFTKPSDNINWVFGPGSSPQNRISPILYLAIIMVLYPLVIVLPTHFLIMALFG
jgi:hypothetical protein